MISVIIADDHNLVRQGIRALLEKVSDIRVVGEASDGQQAIEMCVQLRPDVLVIDIVMPRVNGLQAVERLRSDNIPTRAVMLSMYSDETLIRQALTKGVKGYVLKQAVSEELLLAIRAAVRGETYLSPLVSSILVESAIQGRALGDEGDAFDHLSLREREVLQLLAEGHTNGEIATTLVLSERTIEKHRAALMEKLGYHNLAGLVRVAIKHGMISLND
ncbi:MAG: DNA-binding response regulator [Chloroflexi bacterium]|nr:MAG: DNA-binding response regulator [Chloroflexota bacterium]